MKTRSNDWLVGSAVLGALVLVVVATLWLQGTDIGERSEKVTARFRDVGNMQVGNAVVIRGVGAGRVEDISLSDNGWVLAGLALDDDVELPADPVVLIQASTLFGEWQATVTSREAVPANRGIEGQLDDSDGAPPGSLPGAVLPDIAQLTTVAGGIAGNVASVAERVRTAFDEDAARELRASISNFNTMSAELARAVRAQSRNLDSIAVDVRSGAGDLSTAAAALSRSMGRVDMATDSGEIAAIVAETQRAVVDLREAAGRLNQLTVALSGAESNLVGMIGKADTLLGKIDRGEGTLGLLVNSPALYHHSDSLMVELRLLIADVKRDPKRYFGLSIF